MGDLLAYWALLHVPPAVGLPVSFQYQLAVQLLALVAEVMALAAHTPPLLCCRGE